MTSTTTTDIRLQLSDGTVYTATSDVPATGKMASATVTFTNSPPAAPYDKIPQELKARRQWLTWNLVNETKIPVTPRGTAFKVNDPSTFSSYDEVKHLDRIAYCFTEDDPFFGVDLDDCIVDGKLTAGAQIVMTLFQGKCYCETSPSGEGLKLIGVGKKPDQMRCEYYLLEQKIEVYDHSRFWTMTNNVFVDQTKIQDCQEGLNQLFRLVHKTDTFKPVVNRAPAFESTDNSLINRAQSYVQKIGVPSKGTINNTLFKTAGHLHSFRDEFGGKLSHDQIFDLLWHWCGNCDPDLTPEYVRKRIRTSETCGTPPAEKFPTSMNCPPVDVSAVDELNASQDDHDDETIVESLVPETGLIREIYDYYWDIAFCRSSLIGMATAMSLVETLFGHRVKSKSGCRTNDYNVVLAPTGSGKERCEDTITRIFDAANASNMILPSGVQSGNGLLTALSEQPCSIWIKDEFGVYLESVFGKKSSVHKEEVGRLLLELYGKSNGRFSGNAHSSGSKNQIEQPHLVLLGMSTQGSLANTIDFTRIEGGSVNRISWWIVTERPKLRLDVVDKTVPSPLASKVASWVEFRPEEFLPPKPNPVVIEFAPEAQSLWNEHARGIESMQESESAMVSALWSRTATRTIKFALCSVCSRIAGPEAFKESTPPSIELSDVEWAIKLSDYLTRSTVRFMNASVVDVGQLRAKKIILDVVSKTKDWVKQRLFQANHKMEPSEFRAAARKLAAEDKIEIQEKPCGKKMVMSVRAKM